MKLRLRRFGIRFSLLCLASLPQAARADTTASGTEFQRVVAGFGKVNTIAGRGLVNTCNGWTLSMEGGTATQAELSRPHMAQADAAGNVYIADKNSHRILMVKPEGTIHTVAGSGARGDGGEGLATTIPLREPNGLFTFPDGTTYFVEVDDNCSTGQTFAGGKIRRIGTDGMMTTIIVDPGLLVGRGLWVSKDESLIYYCSGTSVKRWTPGEGIEIFSSGYQQLGNLDVHPISGLVCTTDRDGHRVYRISADGTTKTSIAGNGGTSGGASGGPATSKALEDVRGIAFRPDGSYFLCQHKGEHAVWFVDTAGLIWKLVGGANNAHGGDGVPLSSGPGTRISEPRAVAIAPNGDLLITENDDGYIRRITNTCVEAEIVAVKREAGGLEITWRSHREGSYTIQESADMKTWTPGLDPVTSNGPTSTTVIGTGTVRGFVRVLQN